MQDLVSVIIPTYKRPDRLERSVRSVLNQNYSNFEVIIVDDDKVGNESVKVIENLDDKRITLLKNQRAKGANGARNTGILNSKGKYLAFLDDDDEWLANNLISQIDRIKDTDDKTGMVYGGYLMEKNNNWLENYQNKEGDLFSDLLLDKLYIGASSNIFIKKEVIKKVGLWDENLKRQQDLEFLLRVFKDFHVVFNKNIIARIYGHNDPPPSRSYKAREDFLKTISSDLDKLPDRQRREFLSNHFRRQSMYQTQERNYKESVKLWKKAFNQKKFSFKKDVKIVLAFIKSTF